MKITKIILTFVLVSFVTGCSTKNWSDNYDMSTDKEAVLSAVKAMRYDNKIGKRKGAAQYLKMLDITEEQANILEDVLKESQPEYASMEIINSLISRGYKKQALAGLIKGLQHKSGRVRVHSLMHLANYGCDAENLLPMIKVISSNDGRGVQERARIAYRQISLDCMSKRSSADFIEQR